MSEFDSMSAAELRQALADYARGSQPAAPQQPDAPGCEGLSPAARETARTLYASSIMAKKAGEVSKTERDFLAASIAAVAREMSGQ